MGFLCCGGEGPSKEEQEMNLEYKSLTLTDETKYFLY